MIDTKALHILDIEVPQKLLLRSLLRKYPVIKLEGKVFRAKEALKILFLAAIVQNLLG